MELTFEDFQNALSNASIITQTLVQTFHRQWRERRQKLIRNSSFCESPDAHKGALKVARHWERLALRLLRRALARGRRSQSLHEWNFSKLNPDLNKVLRRRPDDDEVKGRRAGWLLKRGQFNTAYQKRWFVVSSDSIMSWFAEAQVWLDRNPKRYKP